MATVSSGSFNTSAYSNRYLTFSWSIKSQSVANNTTTISWSLKGAGSASGYYKCQNITVKIAGAVVYQHLKDTNGRIDLYNGTSVASGTYTITHNSDGNKNFTAYVEAGIYNWSPNCSGSKSWDLTQIPRQATISSAPNFNDEANPTITYSNPAGSAVSTLQACIASSDGKTIYASYRDISKTGTSYTFSLTTTERNALRNATPNSNSLTVKFYVKTVIGDSTFYSTSSKTLTIVNANPTISPTVKDIGATSITLTGNADGTVIKYFNYMTITFGASALKGATIKSQKCVCGSKSITADGDMSNVESGDFVFTVVDSRGNTTTKTVSKTLINYIKKTCSMSSKSFTTDGVISFTLKGNYWTGNFGAVDNELTLKYRYKTQDGSYGDYITLTPTISGTTYNTTVSISDLDYRTNYVVQVSYGDKTGTSTLSAQTFSCLPVFDWSQDDFNFNVPITADDIDVGKGSMITTNPTPTSFVNARNNAGYKAEYVEASDKWQPALSMKTASGDWSLGIYGENLYLSYTTDEDYDAGNNSGIRHYFNPSGGVNFSSNALNDYVVAYGSSGIWNYRKWKSGVAECWGLTGNYTPTQLSNAGANTITLTLPFTFTSTDYKTQITPARTGLFVSYYGDCNTDTAQEITHTTTQLTFSYYYRNATAYGTSFNVYVVGNWK